MKKTLKTGATATSMLGVGGKKAAPPFGQESDEEQEPKVNRYQTRPPQLQEVNRQVGPSSYKPEVPKRAPPKVTGMTSATDRLVKWEEEIERQDYNQDSKGRMLKKKEGAAGSKKAA